MENSLQCLTLIFAYVFSKVPRMLMGSYKYQITARGMEQWISLQREDRQLNESSELNILSSFHMWLLNTALNNFEELEQDPLMCMVLKFSFKILL